MPEYFCLANSNAAPFFSDTDKFFVNAENPQEACEKARINYQHPFGLYAVAVYHDANSYHKKEKPLSSWLSDKAKKDSAGTQPPSAGAANRRA